MLKNTASLLLIMFVCYFIFFCIYLKWNHWSETRIEYALLICVRTTYIESLGFLPYSVFAESVFYLFSLITLNSCKNASSASLSKWSGLSLSLWIVRSTTFAPGLACLVPSSKCHSEDEIYLWNTRYGFLEKFELNVRTSQCKEWKEGESASELEPENLATPRVSSHFITM